jgi:hypothetical protein
MLMAREALQDLLRDHVRRALSLWPDRPYFCTKLWQAGRLHLLDGCDRAGPGAKQ